MKTTALIAITLALAGCTSPRISRDLTSGQIGCSPSDIAITDETVHSGVHTWTATCKGRDYVCNYHTTTGAKCTDKR